jgi:transaldolase
MYLDELVAPRSVNTLPPPTIEATLDHGRTEVTIFDDLKGAGRIMEQLAERGIHIDDVTEKLRRDGVDAFAKSFEALLANLEQKRELRRAAR